MKYIEFDWAELNRDFLFGMWYDLENKIMGQELTGQQLFQIITSQIHKYLPIRARKIRNKSMGRHNIAIGGSYCFESDEQRKKSITIDFYFKNLILP